MSYLTLIQSSQDEGSGVRRYSAARVLGEIGIRLMKQLKFKPTAKRNPVGLVTV